MVILFRYCNTLQGGSSRGEKTGLKPPLTCGYTHCTLRGQPQEKNPIGSSGWIQYYPINSCNGVGTFDFLFDHFSNWRVKASCMGKSLSSVDAYVGVVHWRKEKRQM